jgi:ABC-type transporter Mla MlaB component
VPATAFDGFNLDTRADGTLAVSGAISYENAARVYRAVPMPAKSGGEIDIDLSGLRDADSATLAVLIGWSAHARQNGTILRYRNAPQTLGNLARLSNVDGLLGLSAA